MTKICIFDFETYDPGLIKYGAGWCFKYHFPEYVFNVLGVGIKEIETIGDDYFEKDSYYVDFTYDNFYTRNLEVLKKIILTSDRLVGHNITYDLGCLYYLFKNDKEFLTNLQFKNIVDTVLLAKHDNQEYFSYSLDTLCRIYKCKKIKQSEILHDYAWNSKLYQMSYKETYQKRNNVNTGGNRLARPSEAVLEKWCKSNMNIFPSKIIGEYCIQDIEATYELFKILFNKLSTYEFDTILISDSKILWLCLEMKLRGVRIDLKKLSLLIDKYEYLIASTRTNILSLLGSTIDNDVEININSVYQLANALIKVGYTNIPITEKGNYSITGEWIREQEGEVFKQLSIYKKAKTALRNFCAKLLMYQEAIPKKYIINDKGFLFPTLKPYGATRTGRFSSGSAAVLAAKGQIVNLEISIQQVPKRDPEFGEPIRELFTVNDDNEVLICADFNSQEPRLQVHYAKILGCSGVDNIIKQYTENPKLSYHSIIAEKIGREKDIAKTINLGLSYGMREKKLIKSLKVNEKEGKKIISSYHRLIPFMGQLQKLTDHIIVKNGYIKLIDGSKLNLEVKSWQPNGLSKLIQGSAAAQCRRAMILADEAGLRLLFSVHDEIITITTKEKAEKDLQTLIRCMEQAYKLKVPVVAEGGIGSNWREAKP